MLFLTALFALGSDKTPAHAAGEIDAHLMCGWQVTPRSQTVSIDPDLSAAGVTYADVIAAFEPWNQLFEHTYGFPIFVPFDGYWQDADILLTAHGTPFTWVQGLCDSSFVQRGSNQSIVFLGVDDAWRNAQVLPHELGHALGLADHGNSDEAVAGHIGFKPCANYIGVMSYCTSPQSWFLDLGIPGLFLDGDLVRAYWSQ